MNPDIGNGLFELIGAWFTWKNAMVLYKEKIVTGIYWPTTAFFSLWGIWNLYYYPTFNQWFSFAGGIALVLGNILWVVLALRYKHSTQCKDFDGTY